MAESTFYPWFSAFGFTFGRTRESVLGRGGGKFPQVVNYQPLNQKAVLMDTDSPGSLMLIAMQVPHLNTIISTGAELFSLMEIKHFNKKGEEIPFEKSKVLQFLRQPNPLQMQEQYLYEFYVMNGVYNKTFQHLIRPFSFEKLPKAMWILPSGWMKINATGKLYFQTDLNEIIEDYELLDSKNTKFETDKIIYMSEGIGNNVLDPISRVHANIIPLSNIVASLKSENIIVTERGAIGFISPDGVARDSDGALPYTEDEQERTKSEYQNVYNLDSRKGHVFFPAVPLKWVPMTFPIKDLALDEGIERAFNALCGAYRQDRDIHPSVKGATYENKAAGLRSTIQNGMQPLADKLMRQLTKNLIDIGTGEYLSASYDYLSYMQEDAVRMAEAKLKTAQATDILLKNGTIDHDTVAEMNDVDQTGDKVIQQTAQLTSGQDKK